MDIQRTIILMPIVGVLLIASYGFGATLATTSDVNQIKSLKIFTTTPQEVVDIIDMGTGDTINSILFDFKGNLASGTTVDVSIKDSSGVEIGSGSETLSSQTDVVTVTLTDTINATERPTMASLSVITS